MDKKNLIINAREDLYSEIKDQYFLSPRSQDGSYGAIMNILFEPSIGVNQQFHETMKKLNLKPRQYLAAHFRGRVSDHLLVLNGEPIFLIKLMTIYHFLIITTIDI